MKIRSQLIIFLAGVILIPTLTFFAYPAYRYLNRPERQFFSNSKHIKDLEYLQLSKPDMRAIRQILKTVPENAEFALAENHNKILYSTIPDFIQAQKIEANDFFEFINSTKDSYFYQISRTSTEETKSDFILVSRLPKGTNYVKRNSFDRLLAKLLFFIIIFEFFCISIVIRLTRTVSKSIMILSETTERITDGDLEAQVENPQKHRYSNEITRLTENLDKMRLKLKDEIDRRNRFIMGISHDLRTPVAVIKGYTEAMRDGMCENPDEVKKSLNIISSKTDQLEHMVNTLINFVKLNQTDWMSQLKRQKIGPVLRDFAKTSVTTGDIFKRKVSAQIEVDENLELAFDQSLIQRTLENLFSNALRYTKENDKIEILAIQEKSSLQIIIKDEGIGIEKKDLDKIFDLFYRATNSRREEGMGIGLSVVKTIVNAHGWSIKVDSEKDIGTVFTISIPLEEHKEA
ncbi:MAG: HAMP domain-containing histidine kinase [Treponema sp.]|nr:HAMP domain-containing histidine kinase [Candidatus Treponema equifaecale]